MFTSNCSTNCSGRADLPVDLDARQRVPTGLKATMRDESWWQSMNRSYRLGRTTHKPETL
jgi:hypothetical protein